MQQTKHPTHTKITTPEGFPYDLPDGNWFQQLVNAILVDKGAFFIHEEGSPYLGLSLEEQKQLAKMRRPIGKVPKWRTSKMRSATKKDYEKLLLACTETLVHAWHDPNQRLDYVNVYVRLPFNWRKYSSPDLPKPFIVGYDDWTVVVSWRVNKIVDWLYEKGYSPYTAQELRKSIFAILHEQERFDFYYEYAATESIIELYSDVIEDTKQGKLKGGNRRPSKLAQANGEIVVDKIEEV